MPGGPPWGSVQVFHSQDGIDLKIVFNVTGSVNDNDEVDLRFSLNDNSPATTTGGPNDWGVALYAVPANATPLWGPVSTPNAWTPVPAADYSITSTGAQQYTFVFHLPVTGIPWLNSPFSVNPIGFGIQFTDPLANLENLSAQYFQWPTNTADPLYYNPTNWGKLCFDAATTYPDVSVIDVRNTGPAGPYGLSPASSGNANSFEVVLANPGGTLLPNATNVRVNLYLAAFGLGEKWHRIDTFNTLTSDCAANSGWTTYAPGFMPLLTQADFCTGNAPQQDIQAAPIADVNNNMATYTISGGVSANPDPRLPNIEIDPAPAPYQAVSWTLQAAQDKDFTGGRTHECMWAEAVFANDPNPNNNHIQRNMDFPAAPMNHKINRVFSLSWNAFQQYDPNAGKPMYLQVSRLNMDDSVKFDLAAPNVRLLPNGLYQADLKGLGSFPVDAGITATNASLTGKTLKENLLIPPKAGGDIDQPSHCWLWRLFHHREAGNPVYVRVTPGTTLWIVNYMLDDNDVQYVDVDGKGPLPRSGAVGLASGMVKQTHGKLLVETARLGELVISFDNFKTGAGIGQGGQVRVPAGATSLALAINNFKDWYREDSGTGFRVKVTERLPGSPAAAVARASAVGEVGIQVEPIAQVLPQICVGGYEDTGKKKPINGRQYEMLRYLGDVCWGIPNVLPEKGRANLDRSDKAPAGTK
jgi:hypothetical protein